MSNPIIQRPAAAAPSARRLAVRRLRDLIRVEITDAQAEAAGMDRLAPDISTENELMVRYGASRDTVREALGLLADEGVIERRRRVGTLPVGTQSTLPALLPPSGVSLADHLHIASITPRLLHWEWMPAPAVVAAKLDGVRPGDDCLCIDYVMLRDGKPSCVITNYLRAQEATAISPLSFDTDFYSLLEGETPRIGSQDITLQASVADPQVASLLSIEPGEPVLWFEQVIRDLHGEAIDFAVAQFRRELRVSVSSLPRLDLSGLRDGGGAA